MFTAPRKEAFRSQQKVRELPPPLKGLHSASRINATPAGYALRLDNLVGRTDGLHIRAGHTVVMSGLGGSVVSLMHHKNKVFAATALQVTDGATSTSCLGGDWHSDRISNPGGLFLVAANGGDGLRVYDGSSWQTVALDGLDASTIVDLCVHQSRLWLVPRNSLTIYYLDVDVFAGKVHPVYLAPLVRQGGTVAAITSITQDGGRNANDQLAIITTKGEMILWNGADPAKAETWAMAGVYAMPEPVGNRCFADWGGRNVYLSKGGVIPLPDALSKPGPEKQLASLSVDIWPTLNPLLASGSWSMAKSIEHEMLVVSGPTGQFVRSGTGAWSTFSLNATCWLDAPTGLYFGTSDGKVCKYGGTTDNGQPISAYMVDRYDRLGTATVKTASQVRPIYLADHPYKPRVQMLANYREPPTTFAAHWTDGSDPASWMPPGGLVRGASNRQGPWRGVSGEGTALALALGIKTTTPIVYQGYDLAYEIGGAT